MNNSILILLTALFPVAVLIYYIYRKDKGAPEPTGQLVKAFVLGTLSVPLSLCISMPLMILGLVPSEIVTFLDGVSTAFLGAAVPEEIAKFLILWLVLRDNRYFDERMDGIVYSVCVSLGFASIENILYLFSNPDTYLSVGLGRSLFAVPGHFCFGILMGYYYSLAKFYPSHSFRNMCLTLLAPILAHGIYDSILFVSDVAPAISGLLTLLFLVFCFKMWKYAGKSIQTHLDRDFKMKY